MIYKRISVNLVSATPLPLMPCVFQGARLFSIGSRPVNADIMWPTATAEGCNSPPAARAAEGTALKRGVDQ